MRDPRKDKGICDCDLSREENQALVTEAAPQVWKRDKQVHDLRTELSLQTLHQEHVTQHQSQEHAGPHQHLTRLVHETQQYQELFEESRAARSATGTEIERPRQREAELPRQARRARFDALCFRNRTFFFLRTELIKASNGHGVSNQREVQKVTLEGVSHKRAESEAGSRRQDQTSSTKHNVETRTSSWSTACVTSD